MQSLGCPTSVVRALRFRRRCGKMGTLGKHGSKLIFAGRSELCTTRAAGSGEWRRTLFCGHMVTGRRLGGADVYQRFVLSVILCYLWICQLVQRCTSRGLLNSPRLLKSLRRTCVHGSSAAFVRFLLFRAFPPLVRVGYFRDRKCPPKIPSHPTI